MEFGENPRSKARTNNKLNPHMATESNLGHRGGGRALSPLRHPSSPNKHLFNKLRVTPVKPGCISRGTASLKSLSLRDTDFFEMIVHEAEGRINYRLTVLSTITS